MTEYISREAGMELLSQPITMSMCLSVSECHNKNAQRRIDLDLIENLPAADVRENRRGMFIPARKKFIISHGLRHSRNPCVNIGSI